MQADNSHHIVEAARRRAVQTRQRAIAALRHMDATGQRISFEAVAREAGVARSWLYTQDDPSPQVRAMIIRIAKDNLRCKILHAAARLTRGARRRQLRIQASWPWARDIVTAWNRISALAHAP